MLFPSCCDPNCKRSKNAPLSLYQLLVAATFKGAAMSTFKANAFLLKSLLDGIGEGKIRLPDFQRGWIWDDARIKDLLVSISRGFPIGAVMTLDAGGDIQFRSRLIEGVASNGNAPTGPIPARRPTAAHIVVPGAAV